MTTPVRFHESSYFGAVTHNNAAGSSLAVIKSVLVDGYGSQTVTITRTGSVATVTFPTSPGYRLSNTLIDISGANETEYNGTKRITMTGANTGTFTVTGTPNTPATGTITAKVGGAGWSVVFSGTNVAVFRMGSGSQRYLYVSDTVANSSPLVYMAEGFLDISTPVSRFPTTTQLSSCFMAKPSTSSACRWKMVANDQMFFFYMQSDTPETFPQLYHFGDGIPENNVDTFFTMLQANSTSGTSSQESGNLASSYAALTAGTYVARRFGGIGGGYSVGRFVEAPGFALTRIGGGGYIFPNPITGKMHMTPVYVGDPWGKRGRVPGLFCPLHNIPLQNYEEFDGTDTFAGRRFMALNLYSSAQAFVEISDTWYN